MHNNTKLKVCGIKCPVNMTEVAAAKPDYMGFIFHKHSPRDVSETIAELPLEQLPGSTEKVAVMVNKPLSEARHILTTYRFDLVQLHGNESPDYCRSIRENAKVIKAFAVSDRLPENLADYMDCCDYFLFDTKSDKAGGSGKTFDHTLLAGYDFDKQYFLGGGIGPDFSIDEKTTYPGLHALDINSRFETAPGIKNVPKLKAFMSTIRQSDHGHEVPKGCFPDSDGYYGQFGGAYIPEMLYPNVEELRINYREVLQSESFQKEFHKLLKDYVGRPTALYFSDNLSKETGARVYLKREDLCHTGAHKLNNVVGQALFAKHLNKKRIIAETGAGQHGVAAATVCALLRIPCTVFMGSKDIARQQPNVLRMKMLGAEVIPVESGSKTLKDSTNEAIRHWINDPEDTYYLIGSTIGPHPYPDLVARLQSVISKEIMEQLLEKEGKDVPDYVFACAGGGSNAAGAFFHFIGNGKTRLVGVEAGGKGADSGKTAATIGKGSPGIIHGCKTLLLQTPDGQVTEAHSVSAGLDYPGIGPMHSYLHQSKLAAFIPVNDNEALNAAMRFSRAEGIIPALESAHAIAALDKYSFSAGDVVVLCLSGRGDKDLQTYEKHFR